MSKQEKRVKVMKPWLSFIVLGILAVFLLLQPFLECRLAFLTVVILSDFRNHIRNILEDGELDEDATVRKFRTVQTEGSRQVSRELDYYSLDMILAVGYRVRSNVGIHFRRWASGVLTEYMKKGFVLNDERLRNPREFGADYFDELLERIRDIRASEKRIYQKVKEIFALSVDYDSQSNAAQLFFKSVQNKLEYAATGHTAPEIIAARADATKDNMGLTAFKGAKVRKADVTIAKNYMTQEEISTLNLIVNMYLDYAELQAKQRHAMHKPVRPLAPFSLFVVGGKVFEPLNFVLLLRKLPLHLFFLGLQLFDFFFVHDFTLLTDK